MSESKNQTGSYVALLRRKDGGVPLCVRILAETEEHWDVEELDIAMEGYYKPVRTKLLKIEWERDNTPWTVSKEQGRGKK